MCLHDCCGHAVLQICGHACSAACSVHEAESCWHLLGPAACALPGRSCAESGMCVQGSLWNMWSCKLHSHMQCSVCSHRLLPQSQMNFLGVTVQTHAHALLIPTNVARHAVSD